MTTLTFVHGVRDFEHFRSVYDSHADVRTELAVQDDTIFRSIEDPNEVAIVLDFPDATTADQFLQSPALQEAMSEAGLTGEPTICRSA